MASLKQISDTRAETFFFFWPSTRIDLNMELDPNRQYSLEETIKILTGVIEVDYDNAGNDVSNPHC